MSLQILPQAQAGVPAGGAANQILSKASATNHDLAWVTPGAGGLTLPFTQSLTFSPDNTLDIGAFGASRPSAVHVGSFVNIGTSLVLTLGSSSGGTYIGFGGTNIMEFGTAGMPRLRLNATGHLLAGVDNAYDIGAAGATRPRTIYAGTSIEGPTGTFSDLGVSNTATVGFLAGAASNLEIQVTTATRMVVGGTRRWVFSAADFSPYVTNTYDIGTTSVRPRNLYLGSVLNVTGTTSLGNVNTWPGTALYIGHNATLTGTTQNGVNVAFTGSTGATAAITGVNVGVSTSTSTATTNLYGMWVQAPYIQTAATITNAYGLRIDNHGYFAVTNAYGVYIAAQSGASTTNVGLFNGGTTQLGGNVAFPTDNTYDIGASGATRPKNIYAAGFFNAPTAQVNTVQSPSNSILTLNAPGALGTLALETNSVDRWYVASAGGLIAAADNTYDIGASGASRPKNLYLAGNLTASQVYASTVWTPSSVLGFGDTTNGTRWMIMQSGGSLQPFTDNLFDLGDSTHKPRKIYTKTLEVDDAGYNTPSFGNQGFTALGGRTKIGGGVGGMDPICYTSFGANQPSTSIMTGSSQYMVLSEYWANSLGTGIVKGWEVGLIGSPNGTSQMMGFNLKSMQRNGAGVVQYAKQLVINGQDSTNGSIENIGIDIGDQSGASSRNLSIWCKGPALFEKALTVTGVITVGTTAQPKITVASGAPSSPATGDLWIW